MRKTGSKISKARQLEERVTYRAATQLRMTYEILSLKNDQSNRPAIEKSVGCDTPDLRRQDEEAGRTEKKKNGSILCPYTLHS